MILFTMRLYLLHESVTLLLYNVLPIGYRQKYNPESTHVAVASPRVLVAMHRQRKLTVTLGKNLTCDFVGILGKWS